jgi:N-acetylglucosamine-6-phosphate deacetylase
MNPLRFDGTVICPSGVIRDGSVITYGNRIEFVDSTENLPTQYAELDPIRAALVLPGLVDLHCHGGGGASFPDATGLDEIRTAADEHLAHGTTTMLASLVAAPLDALLAQVRLLAAACAEGIVSGIHAEGPFLAPGRCGALAPEAMIAPDIAIGRKLFEAANGYLATITIAPELPEANAVAIDLAGGGVVPSVGHTDAHARETTEFLRVARLALVGTGSVPTVTHLFNAMRPIHHRDPGPALAGLAAAARGEAVVELIADGIHLDPATVTAVFDMIGPTGIALVSDATAAAGMGDGNFLLGGCAVNVREGRATLADGHTISGGTAHLLDVVRCSVAAGVRLVDAVQSASTTPADVLGRSDLGRLENGARADILLTDAKLVPVEVYRSGVKVH